MGTSTSNPYAGQALQPNVKNAYETALGGATDMAGAGGQALGQAD